MLTITVTAGHDQAGSKLKGHSCPTVLLFLLAPALLNASELKPETLQAWDAYVRAAKMRMEARARGQAPFLWIDEERQLAQRVRASEVVVKAVGGGSPHTVPSGLIHDWMGAVFVPKTRLEDVAAVLDDYERYKDFYRPMVVKARLLELRGDHETVTLLMKQKALSVTAAVESVNDVQIANLGGGRTYRVSTSVRVREIAEYGKPGQHALPEDYGPGYVWRTLIVTRLQERDGGVYTELELIALSRNIPVLFRWLLQPLAERLPRNILLAMLQDTRDAVPQETQAGALKAQASPH